MGLSKWEGAPGLTVFGGGGKAGYGGKGGAVPGLGSQEPGC